MQKIQKTLGSSLPGEMFSEMRELERVELEDGQRGENSMSADISGRIVERWLCGLELVDKAGDEELQTVVQSETVRVALAMLAPDTA